VRSPTFKPALVVVAAINSTTGSCDRRVGSACAKVCCDCGQNTGLRCSYLVLSLFDVPGVGLVWWILWSNIPEQCVRSANFLQLELLPQQAYTRFHSSHSPIRPYDLSTRGPWVVAHAPLAVAASDGMEAISCDTDAVVRLVTTRRSPHTLALAPTSLHAIRHDLAAVSVLVVVPPSHAADRLSRD